MNLTLNMNRTAGKILHLPARMMRRTTQSEAKRDTRSGCGLECLSAKLASAAAISKSHRPPGRLPPQQRSVADKASAARESAKEVLYHQGRSPETRADRRRWQACFRAEKKNAEQEDTIARAKAAAKSRCAPRCWKESSGHAATCQIEG